MGKCLPYKHEDLSLDPQCPSKSQKRWYMPAIPVLGR